MAANRIAGAKKAGAVHGGKINQSFLNNGSKDATTARQKNLAKTLRGMSKGGGRFGVEKK